MSGWAGNDSCAGAFECRDLLICAGGSPGDDRARVPHTPARRSAAPHDQRRYWFGKLRASNVLRGFLLLGPPDLPNEHDAIGIHVIVEQLQDIDEGSAAYWIASDPNRSGLADAKPRELADCFVGERAAAGDDPRRVRACGCCRA